MRFCYCITIESHPGLGHSVALILLHECVPFVRSHLSVNISGTFVLVNVYRFPSTGVKQMLSVTRACIRLTAQPTVSMMTISCPRRVRLFVTSKGKKIKRSLDFDNRLNHLPHKTKVGLHLTGHVDVVTNLRFDI